MSIQMINGKKTAVINVFIDPERGFLDLSLTDAQGGVLYVPQGEEITSKMGGVISQSRNTTFVLAQDYHPANHISFMINHPGIMEYRIEKFKEFLIENNQPVPTDEKQLYAQAQQPVHFFNGPDNPVPFLFQDIILDDEGNILGLREGNRIRKVEVTTSSGLAPSARDRGRVTAVLDDYLDKSYDELKAEQPLVLQTLWQKHAVQGTDSSQYPEDMNLPKGLRDLMKGDLASPMIYYRDPSTGNEFYIVRKGQNSEVDSYGITVENDGKSHTKADDVFREIAENFRKQGVEDVVINVGGLASNFCVEYSIDNIADFAAGEFRSRLMSVAVNFVPEISRGIPTPDGRDVNEAVAERVKASRGVGTNDIEGIMALSAPAKAQPAIKPKFPGMGLR